MRHLCDSNVFLAAIIEAHPNHESARDWFDGLTESDTAEFCRATQNSVMRLLCQSLAPDYVPLTNRRAISIYRSLRRDSRIGFCAEPTGIEETWLQFADTDDAAPKIWMDAYLAAFAIRAGIRFVTFDKGFRKYAGLDLVLL